MYDVQKTREMNDAFRTSLLGGRVMITQGVLALPNLEEVMCGVREFDNFSEDNDPYHEHALGLLNHAGQNILWKIDYYSLDLQGGSSDPADSSVTVRVLTVMLSSEY
jgi:hypothetical protein